MTAAVAPALIEVERIAQQDWSLAEELYGRIAELGDPRGWMAIGRRLCAVEPRDIPRAVECFERAAKMGSVDGAVQVGFMALHGQGSPKDLAKALRFLEQAADGGACIPATRAGWLWYSGEVGTKDAARAITLWRRAIALEDEPEAMLLLARALIEGQVPRDVPAAAHWFRRGTNESLALAKKATTKARGEMFQAWGREGISGVRHIEAELRALAESGDAAAQCELSYAISGGFVAESDEAVAVKWLRAAADAGHGDACLRLAHRHRLGRGVPEDLEAFEELLRRAVAAGHAPAHHDLAYALSTGAFGARDLDGAITHYRQSVEGGGRASEKDLALALAERVRASAQRAVDDRADDEEITRMLLRLAARDDIGAMLWLGKRLRDGIGAPVDFVQAVRWFWRALELGNGDGVHEAHPCIAKMTPDQLREADRLADGNGACAMAAIRGES